MSLIADQQLAQDTTMKPQLAIRFFRLLGHDTGPLRAIVALGLLLSGVAMLWLQSGNSRGYALMEHVMPVPAWGCLFLVVGTAGFLGTVVRYPYYLRLFIETAGAWTWSFVALSQLWEPPLTPMEPLLLLPALVEAWVIIKVVVEGPR